MERGTQSILLISNAPCTDKYPLNKPSNFTTPLLEPLQLGEGWEVCIVSIYYPVTWFNVAQDYEVNYTTLNNEEAPIKHEKLSLPMGNYKSREEIIDVLVERMNKKIQRVVPNSEVIISNDKYRSKLTLGVDLAEIYLVGEKKNDLLNFLGFKSIPSRGLMNDVAYQTLSAMAHEKLDPLREKLIPDTNEYILSPESDLVTTLECQLKTSNLMMVYTDMIQYTMIGNTAAPLLGVVPIREAEYGTTVQYVFNAPQWVPLNKSTVDTINIKLYDEYGCELQFASGTVMVQLMLRRKRSIL